MCGLHGLRISLLSSTGQFNWTCEIKDIASQAEKTNY
jgi:hypothetical protein